MAKKSSSKSKKSSSSEPPPSSGWKRTIFFLLIVVGIIAGAAYYFMGGSGFSLTSTPMATTATPGLPLVGGITSGGITGGGIVGIIFAILLVGGMVLAAVMWPGKVEEDAGKGAGGRFQSGVKKMKKQTGQVVEAVTAKAGQIATAAKKKFKKDENKAKAEVKQSEQKSGKTKQKIGGFFKFPRSTIPRRRKNKSNTE